MKRKIILDFDDTLFKASEVVISLLNKKYNLNQTSEDLTDWNYKSIYSEITPQEVIDIYNSKELFDNLHPQEWVETFLQKFVDHYEYIICSAGTSTNLALKEKVCRRWFNNISVPFHFIGINIDNQNVNNIIIDKSMHDFSDALFCVDDNIHALTSLNVPKKILIKNYRNTNYNKLPPNSTNIYTVNSFKEIYQMCTFDLKLREEDEIIG